ncbi:unnamed protein product, partial [Brassica oleracea var. botrytis]
VVFVVVLTVCTLLLLDTPHQRFYLAGGNTTLFPLPTSHTLAFLTSW